MISEYLPNIKSLILDMDGVLWHDSQPIGDLPVIFEHIKASEIKFILATNNATRSIEEYLAKLHGFGVKLEPQQVISTPEAVGIYLSERYPDGAGVYVVGEPGFKETLGRYNIKIADKNDKNVDVVAVGLYFGLTYDELKHASLLIQSGSEFIGANPDKTLPTPEGLIPGAGTIIGALEIATGVKATIVGKPQPLLYQIALKRLGTTPEETLAVGDRLETDIAGAQATGIHTALVLSGASTLDQAMAYNPKPEIIVKDLNELIS